MARLRFGRPISLRWNGLLLEGPALTVFEIPDEYYEEFNQDIGPVEPTLVWLDSDEGATLRGRVTALEGASSTSLSNDPAVALGTASAGVGTESSRDDHVHPTTGLALSGHNHDGSYATTGHNHSGTYEPVNTAILKSVVDAKGDLIVGTAADTVDRLPGSGTNGYVLTYDSAETTGLKWAAAPGSGGGASVGTATPLALGTASAGDDATASREDHVHPTTGLSLEGHTHDSAGATSVVRQYVKNDTTAKVKGDVVYISSADGTNPIVSFADADNESTSSKTLGLLMQSLSSNAFGYVITEGILSGVDTSGAAAEGQSVWLSGTSGKWVYGAPPAKPAHGVYLGVVTKKNVSTGEIFVKVQNGYEIEELHNVSITSTPADKDLLYWDDASSLYKMGSASTVGVSTTSHTHSYASTAHASTHTAAGSDALSGLSPSQITGTAVITTDSRLSDSRTPTAHASSHGSAGADAITIAPSQVTGTAVITSDSRLTDARTPTSHASTHNAGGSDALAIDAVAATGSLRTLGTSSTSAAAGDHTHSAYATAASPTFTGTVTTPLTTAGYVKTSAGGVLSSSASIAQADVTSLTTDLAAKAPTASPTFTGDVTINAQGDIRLADADSSNWVALQAPATVASNVTWTLPSADGTANQALVTNGSGSLSFATPSGGGMTLLATANNATNSLTVSNIPATYKDIYVRIMALSTSTSLNITGVTANTGNMTGMYLATTAIDNDATYTSTTIVGAVANTVTTTATKDFPSAGALIEVENGTYGGILEIWFYDYANASGLNNATRHFKTIALAPNATTSPSNASLSVGNGRFTFATATAAMSSFTINNLAVSAYWAYVYGVS